MKSVLAFTAGFLLLVAMPFLVTAQAPLNNVILGHSGGAGSLNILRRIMERDKIWEKYGLNVKSVYFNSGTVLIQAMAGGNIVGSESEVPGMVNLAVAGVADLKIVTVPSTASSMFSSSARISPSPRISRVSGWRSAELDRRPIQSREWFCARGKSIQTR